MNVELSQDVSTGQFRRTHGKASLAMPFGSRAGFAGVAVPISSVLMAAPQAAP